MPTTLRRALPYIAACALFYIAVRWMTDIFIPFAAAIALAVFLRRASEWVYGHFKIPARVSCILLLLILIAVTLTFAVTLSARLIDEVAELTVRAADSSERLAGMLSDMFDSLAERLPVIPHLNGGLPYSGGDIASIIGSVVGSMLKSLSESLPEFAANVGTALPDALFTLTMTVMTAYYLGSDSGKIKSALKNTLPPDLHGFITLTRTGCLKLCSGWIRSSLILTLLTFAVLLIGMCILRLDYALAAAMITALTDMLPVLGSGMILLPWSCFELLCGRKYTGFGLLILYACITLLKQIAEPKLLGAKDGPHPLLTVASMYVGMKLLGVKGAILTPPFVYMLLSTRNRPH